MPDWGRPYKPEGCLSIDGNFVVASMLAEIKFTTNGKPYLETELTVCEGPYSGEQVVKKIWYASDAGFQELEKLMFKLDPELLKLTSEDAVMARLLPLFNGARFEIYHKAGDDGPLVRFNKVIEKGKGQPVQTPQAQESQVMATSTPF